MHITPKTKPPRIGWFDLWVYRLFYKRWTQHFKTNPVLREKFLTHFNGFHEERKSPIGQLHAVEPIGRLKPEPIAPLKKE